MAVPRKDSLLVPWSTNFNTRAVASAATFGLSAAQVSAYTPLHEAYLASWDAIQGGAKSHSLVVAKDTAKGALLPYARELYALIQNSLNVLDTDKALIGVLVKKTTTTPIPPPDAAPAVDIVSVVGRTVKARLHDSVDSSRKGLPPGVIGANIFTYVGATPPENLESWAFNGGTGRTTVDIVFPTTVAAGVQVWLTAFWFNARKQSGPACTPISTYLQVGNTVVAA